MLEKCQQIELQSCSSNIQNRIRFDSDPINATPIRKIRIFLSSLEQA